jgi:hypothetical protein
VSHLWRPAGTSCPRYRARLLETECC